MYQRPKYPYSYFSQALELNFRVLFPGEYPEESIQELVSKAIAKSVVLTISSCKFKTAKLSLLLAELAYICHSWFQISVLAFVAYSLIQ